MSKKIFVGGLDFKIDDDTLGEGFSRFGDVLEAKVVLDRETGRSRGFGFVTFEDAESVDHAISEMNQTEFSGRTITVSEAVDRRNSMQTQPRRNFDNRRW